MFLEEQSISALERRRHPVRFTASPLVAQEGRASGNDGQAPLFDWTQTPAMHVAPER